MKIFKILKVMLQRIFSQPSIKRFVFIDPHFTRLDVVDSVVDGVLVKRSEYKSVCLGDDYSEFSIHDFSIANVLQVGNTKMLRPVQMVNPDVAGNCIKMDSFLKTNNDEVAS